MKRLNIIIAICCVLTNYTFAQGFFQPKNIPIESVNNVIGDVSFTVKFGELPTAQTDDKLRVQTHLQYVETILRQADISNLTATQQQNRAKILDALHEYWTNGRFPKNDYFTSRKSVFIDKQNTHCAVGYLIKETEGEAVTQLINAKYQFASIYDIKMAEVAKWAVTYGLTIDECAMIQPTYGGWIRPEPVGSRQTAGLFSMEVRSMKVDVKIKETAATTTLEQVFFNPTSNQLQGFYYFPMPKNASIDKFSMFINGVETQGEVLDAAKARQIYEDIVRRSLDPALLEYYNQSLFRVKIFPIQPRSEQKIRLTYTETLRKESGTIEYTFPFGSAENTATKQIPEFSFKVNLETNAKLKNIYSPTHEAEIIRKNDTKAIVGFEGNALKNAANFKLYFNTDDSKIGLSMLTYNDASEDGFFMLNLSPGIADAEEIIAKDITFVVDVSGSMAGEKMEQAKKALIFCIANLNDNDRFNIVRFSTEANGLFEELKIANKENRTIADAYIKKLRPIGGTNIDEALNLALTTKTDENRPYFVIFLTDGKPTIGETNEDQLLKKVADYNPKNTRIFTFGIGTNLNTTLLDKITEMTKSYRTYVLPNEDIEIKVSDFYTKVASPILTNIVVSFDKSFDVSELQPKGLPDIFKGSSLNLLGRYGGSGSGKITVRGKVNGKEKVYTYDATFPKKNTENDFVASLWAASTVGYLLDQIRLNGEQKEVVDEIVRLSKKYGIITPYTSYLILEDEAVSVRTNQLPARDQLLNSRATSAKSESLDEISVTYNSGMNTNTGAVSVDASKRNQRLKQTKNATALRVEEEKLDYVMQNGDVANLASNIKNINGRAFYNNNNEWVDANIPLNQSKKRNVNRVEFNSKAYFKLIADNPEVVDFLALGKNIRFELNEEIVEIYEE
jgi:Ca-activated chloride channel family protein